MRIRMIQQVATVKEYFEEGLVYDVDDKRGKTWIKAGLAMEDKSKDGAPETKMKRLGVN